MAEREGWGFPLASKKAHYFIGAKSLCNEWLYSGDLDPDNGTASVDDCAACRKLMAKRRPTTAEKEG